jgi:hypothetical protein
MIKFTVLFNKLAAHLSSLNDYFLDNEEQHPDFRF